MRGVGVAGYHEDWMDKKGHQHGGQILEHHAGNTAAEPPAFSLFG